MFAFSAPTWRVRKNRRDKIRMLDWDLMSIKRGSKTYDETWQKHLDLANNLDLELIMAPDIWPWTNQEETQEKIDQLRSLVERVVVPIHAQNFEIDCGIAWPTGQWGQKNILPPIWEISDRVEHILGGGPKKQKFLAGYFPNLKSMDGNQIMHNALYHRVWTGQKWAHETDWSKEECFLASMKGLEILWSGEYESVAC